MTTERIILQSPVEIGPTEIKSYELKVPTTWGAGDLATPVITVESKKEVDIPLAPSGSPTVGGDNDRSILLAIDGSALKVNYDYNVFIKFDIGTDTQVAKGVWKCRK